MKLGARLRAEDGFAGGFEALPFGFLVFVVGTLLIVNAWGVFDSHMAASAAARETVRAFVESTGEDHAAQLEAEEAGYAAITGHGKERSRADIRWAQRPELVRCRPVTAVVSYEVPVIALPWVGAFGGGLLRTEARHTEIVDPYRAGLPVEGFDPESCHG